MAVTVQARTRAAIAASSAGRMRVKQGDDLLMDDDIFVELMGDVVEPEREFIQENARSVAALDV